MSKNVQLQIEELKRTISESEKKISLLKKNIKKEFLKDFIEILEKYNVSLVFSNNYCKICFEDYPETTDWPLNISISKLNSVELTKKLEEYK